MQKQGNMRGVALMHFLGGILRCQLDPLVCVLDAVSMPEVQQ